jgi:hypothetical protein
MKIAVIVFLVFSASVNVWEMIKSDRLVVFAVNFLAISIVALTIYYLTIGGC